MPPLKARSALTRTPASRECDDLQGVHYRLPLMPYRGVDFSKKCFIFPGQSAAQPGMGKSDLQRFEILRKRFAVADALATSRGIIAPSLYITDPKRVPLDQTALIQCLALFTMSVGLFELLLVNNEQPSLVMGHSFGEYAALVASGIASFEDVFDQVCERDRVCPLPGRVGAMIAVSASAETTEKLIQALPAVIANKNSPQQTVVSVPPESIKAVMAAFRREKLAAKLLDTIPQPYHSDLLATAAAELRGYVRGKKTFFRAPRIAMLSSVSGKIITLDNFSVDEIKELISEQLTTPVDFIGQLHKATSLGCCHFIELAHHKTCTTWVRDTLQGSPFKVSVPPILVPVPVTSAQANAQNYDSKLVGFLNRVISSVTGYSIEEISLTKNFQEDLGIDSIKKAQIVFDFLESQGDFSIDVQDNMVMNQIRTVEDVLAWYMKDRGEAASGAAEPGVFQWHKPVWGLKKLNAFDRLLAAPAKPCIWIPLSKASVLADEVARANQSGGIIFYDDGSSFVFEEFLAAIQLSFEDLRQLLPEVTLGLVTQEPSSLEVKSLDAFLKSLAYETGRTARSFTFDHFDKKENTDLVEAEMLMPFASTIRFAEGQRYVLTMEACGVVAVAAPVPVTVAAIGGASGVTLEVLKMLVTAGTRNLYITGRRDEDMVRAELDKLRDLGAHVVYVAGDATQYATLETFLDRAVKEHGGVDLLIHGGGIEYSALASQQTPAHVRAQCDIKIDTTRHLISLSRVMPIRKTIAFTSLAGEWGSAGQTIYAYANMMMTHLCEQARTQGLHFETLAWPAWDRIGMTKNDDVYRQILLHGRPFLGLAAGCQLFRDALVDAGDNRRICFDIKGTKGMDILCPQALHGVFPGVANLAPPVHLKHWTLQEYPDLKHHIILGHTVIPITLSLSTFLYLGYFKTGEICKLTDIKAASFMPAHFKDSPYSLNFFPEGQGFRAEVRSNEPHIEARIALCQKGEIENARFVMPENVEYIASRNKDYDDCKLEFQITFNTYRGLDGFTCADLDATQTKVKLGSKPIHFLAFIIEGMLQMGGMGIRYLTEGNRNSVPFAMKSLVVNGEARLTDTYKVVARFMQDTDDLASNELYAYNEEGELFIHIGGEQVRMWSTNDK